ncbi:hypothetical protein GGS23DRAFT_131098 [Durotheca rogersii]|uniref:uncharacterized protein n=1 Tax=Durotheca rogersii TaxID=419775 RepID=UPI00221FD834|nr:uncharacterized protein GGS23DRAFT_131098 [Durotheca rogersii]KAI5861783.1 hypothetical protein GGS23DRAFT_131098 [Durotheca rogersii]
MTHSEIPSRQFRPREKIRRGTVMPLTGRESSRDSIAAAGRAGTACLRQMPPRRARVARTLYTPPSWALLLCVWSSSGRHSLETSRISQACWRFLEWMQVSLGGFRFSKCRLDASEGPVCCCIASPGQYRRSTGAFDLSFPPHDLAFYTYVGAGAAGERGLGLARSNEGPATGMLYYVLLHGRPQSPSLPIMRSLSKRARPCSPVRPVTLDRIGLGRSPPSLPTP